MSIWHFIQVFESVIETNLKFSAEEIETALIQPNKNLAQLHISLLKVSILLWLISLLLILLYVDSVVDCERVGFLKFEACNCYTFE